MCLPLAFDNPLSLSAKRPSLVPRQFIQCVRVLLLQFLVGSRRFVEYTVQFMYILGAMLPLLAVDFTVGGALRGAGDTRFPLVATILGLLVMRCGLASLATYMGLPVVYVYAAIIGDYVLKGCLLLWRFHKGRWKMAISQREPTPQ